MSENMDMVSGSMMFGRGLFLLLVFAGMVLSLLALLKYLGAPR